MKWKAKDLQEWHKWFAWYPVRVDEQWVWLETIERRFFYIHANDPGSVAYVIPDKQGA